MAVSLLRQRTSFRTVIQLVMSSVTVRGSRRHIRALAVHTHDVVCLVKLFKPTQQAAERLNKSLSEFGVHPAVNNWVIHAVTHGQPMRNHPHDVHVFSVIDTGIHVACYVDDVKRQPADGVDNDDHQHHLRYLKQN